MRILKECFFLSFSAKWSSNEEVNKFGQAKTGSGSSEKKVWTPANGAESPSLERRKAKDYKPVGFDGNSLNRSEQKSNKVGQFFLLPVLIFSEILQ